MPLINLSVWFFAKTEAFTVIGAVREISPQMIGGLTPRVPYDWTQPFCVKTKPSSFSPKYSTMSFRSYSPWTRTSKPISSCFLRIRTILSSLNLSYCSRVITPLRSFERFWRTSLVCGNEPIVVVGKTGKLNSFFWIFSRSLRSGKRV